MTVMWTVVSSFKYRKPIEHPLFKTKKEAIARFMSYSAGPEYEWETWYANGYRCRKVRVEFID